MEKKFAAITARFDHHLSPAQLTTALTHNTWYGADKERGNSKYVLAGRAIFKGEVARLLIKYYPAHGAKLEHILGNLFAPKQLDRLWHHLNLAPLIRHGAGIDPATLRHTFVEAFLGCLALHLPPEALRDFIRNEILAHTEHLFAAPKTIDHRAAVDRLCKERHNSATRAEVTECENGWRCTVRLNDAILVGAESASRKYALKKAYKEALRQLNGESELFSASACDNRELELAPTPQAK